MKFKYHGAYKGFYLFDGEKFVKPFRRLDIEETESLASQSGEKIELLVNKIVDIKDEYVVFRKPQDKKKTATKVKKATRVAKKTGENTLESIVSETELSRLVPKFLLEKLAELVESQEKSLDRLPSVLEILDNILYSDGLFRAKSKKLFYYSETELKDYMARFMPFDKLDSKLEQDVLENYPNQYVYEHLPLDYKEKEMMYVFYFIILVELLSILK
ncbi:MAG: exonuclease SbcC [Gemella sp.]|nr:exonuclease SbcC [Gemella sp.]